MESFVWHLMAMGPPVAIGICAIWIGRHPRRRAPSLWEFVTHKTNPGDRTGELGRDPDAMWPEHETKIHTHEQIMAMHERRRLRRASGGTPA